MSAYVPMTDDDCNKVTAKNILEAHSPYMLSHYRPLIRRLEQAVLYRIAEQGLVIVPKELLAEKAALEESFKTASHNAAFYGDLYLEQQAKQAALIAELRWLPRYCLQSSTALDEVLDKYEEKS